MSEHIYKQHDVLIDRYSVHAYLNEGGMQQVFTAMDKTFNRTVALKVPKNSSAEKRFQRSAAVSAGVNHQNVAKTLDYFEQNGKGHLVEEFVSGDHLGARLDHHFLYLDPHLAAKVFSDLTRGLAAIHHTKALHRDLKPSNILTSSDASISVVKITDFGIAKLTEEAFSNIDADDEGSITGSATVLGAVPYMAPEMIENAKTAKLPADVWALGAILFRMMTGNYPFGTGLKAVAKILDGELPSKPPLFDMKKQFTALADDLWAIMAACLVKDPTARPKADDLVQQCAKLCYSTTMRREGTVTDTRYGSQGYIQADDGEEVFFHFDSVFGGPPSKGTRVNFACFPGHPKARAFPVLPLRPAKHS